MRLLASVSPILIFFTLRLGVVDFPLFSTFFFSPGSLRLQVWNWGRLSSELSLQLLITEHTEGVSLFLAADSCRNHTRLLNESPASILSCLINGETKALVSPRSVDWSDSTASLRLRDMFVSLLLLPLLSYLQLPSYGDGAQLFGGFWWVTHQPLQVSFPLILFWGRGLKD